MMFSSTRWNLQRMDNQSTRLSWKKSCLLGECECTQQKNIWIYIYVAISQCSLFSLCFFFLSLSIWNSARCQTAPAVCKKVQWAGPCCHWPIRRLCWACALTQVPLVQRCRRMASSIPALRQYTHLNTRTHTYIHAHTQDAQLKSMHRHTYTHSI